MSLSKRSPDLFLDRIVQFGAPWHGRLDHVPQEAYPAVWNVTLPNDEVRPASPLGAISTGVPYANPYYFASGWKYPPMTGRNALFARPDVPPVVRSPAQLADDAAAGREWRNSAILHAPEFLSEVPNWIWCDATGVRWLVAAWFKSSELEVRVRRFGAFGPYLSGETFTKTYPSSDAAVGQATPPLPAPYSGSTVLGRLHDRTPIGDRAVVMLHVLPPSAMEDRSLEIDRMASGAGMRYLDTLLAVGFIELQMSGTPATGDWDAAFSVLATREATLGVVSQTAHDSQVLRFVTDIVFDPEYVWMGEGLEMTQTITAVGVEEAGPTGRGTAFRRGKQGFDVSVTGRIVSMHYESGALVTITADWRYRDLVEEDSVFAHGGVAYRHYSRPNTGATWTLQSESGAVWRDAAYVATNEHSESLTLRKDGTVFSTWESGHFVEIDQGARYQYAPSFTGTFLVSEWHTGRNAYVTNGASHELAIDWGEPTGVYGYSGFNIGWSSPSAPAAVLLWGPIMGPGVFGVSVVETEYGYSGFARSLVYYSQCCIGYIAVDTDSSADARGVVIGAVSAPSGALPAIAPTVYTPENRPPVFASYNPVTGDAVRSAWPVNWV